MKYLYFITLLFITAFVQAQIVNIPDANFKTQLLLENIVDNDGDGVYLEKVDTNNDGEIQVSEAQSVIRLLIAIPNFPMENIEGIESFTNLEEIHGNTTQIQNVDLSQNLNLIEIDLTSCDMYTLILPPSPNLLEIRIFFNNLTSIDVSQNPNLIRLYPGIGNLTSLDVTQNPNLERLNFSSNQITEIDITQNPKLTLFGCANNQIENLDLSQHYYLEEVYVHNNELLNLDIKNGNNTNMFEVITYDNPSLTCIQVDDVTYANDQNCINNATGWCKDSTAAYSEECVLGVVDLESINLRLYPNPVQNILNITSDIPLDTVQIYSFQGQLIKAGKSNKVDVSNLSSGIYFAVLNKDGQSIVKGFVKS